MAWYVFALVDAVPSSRPGKGIRGALAVLTVGEAFAVVERRADVPPVDFGPLEKHQDVVNRLAALVPAILPVRFGTLLERDALEEALHERDEDISAAFDLVRGRVQFTWRKARVSGHDTRGSRRSALGAPSPAHGSGTDYLRHAARAAKPAAPAAWRALRSTVAPLIAVERYQPPTIALPETLYHLVDRAASVRYATVAAGLRHATPAFTISGPWPPFAFAPEFL